MNSRLYVTTSWDDGNPADFRVAELLNKYGLTGTFYIPQWSDYSTMPAHDIKTLSTEFEIGAHTISHIILTESDSTLARHEIVDSRRWLEDLLGRECDMFCFPQGKFREEHVEMVRDAGYRGARTVELLSTHVTSAASGLVILPTSVQAFEHKRVSYLKNLAKRRSGAGLWNYILAGGPQDWTRLSRSMFEQTRRKEIGTFHLWGHSWELEQHDQWERLESVFQFLASHRDCTDVVTNGELCHQLADGRH